MIRLAWRQFRWQSVIAAGVLIIVGVFAAITGPGLAHLYKTSISACTDTGACAAAKATFLQYDALLRTALSILVVVVPGLFGLFWGAPLVARELESGTFRLAWTQSATRGQWLAAKLVLAGLAVILLAGVLSLTVSLWARPFDLAGADIYSAFDERDIVPIGHAALAFTLAVTAGVLIRRTLPALASTLIVFTGIRVAFNQLVRPHLLAPTLSSGPLDPSDIGFGWSGNVIDLLLTGGKSALQPNTPDIPNAWILSTQIVNKTGQELTSQVFSANCPDVGTGPRSGPTGPAPAAAQNALHQCAANLGANYHIATVYQPAAHYWPLQWAELVVYLAAAIIIATSAFWLTRRR